MLGVGRSALSTSFNHCSPASSARAHAHLFDGGLLPVTGQPDKKTDNTHMDTRRHGGTGATVYSKLPLLEGSDRERDTHRGGVDGASTPASTLVARGENEKPHNCAGIAGHNCWFLKTYGDVNPTWVSGGGLKVTATRRRRAALTQLGNLVHRAASTNEELWPGVIRERNARRTRCERFVCVSFAASRGACLPSRRTRS